MNISLDDLLKGKATKINENVYFETEAYVTPFLERMQKITDDFKVRVETPKQRTLTEKTDDITYNRVWIQALMPESYTVENHRDVIGMIYSLDKASKNIAKFYRGGLNQACTNLCVFNPTYLSVQELKPKSAINYNPLDSLIDKANEIKVFLDKLSNMTFANDDQNINESVGKWVRNCVDMTYNNGLLSHSISSATAVKAYKLLFKDAKSQYFINPDKNSNYFNIYNAFTDIISHDKDITNWCEKILLLNDILGI